MMMTSFVCTYHNTATYIHYNNSYANGG